MQSSSFAIHSRRTILPEGVQEATVLVRNGVIAGVTEGFARYPGMPFVDAGYNVVMPGIVDPHVHINEPGRTDWEGFDTATKAALAGGVTTIVDMPLNAIPVTTSVKALSDKAKAAVAHLHVNCGFWGGVIPGNADEIVPLIEAGVLGFKAFLIDSGIEEFPAVTEKDLRKVMPLLAQHQLPLLVHCELAGKMQARPADARSYQEYLESRPQQWEIDAVELMIRLCAEYKCRTHIVHVSSAESLDMIAQAKKDGLPLTAETGQHYLFFSGEDIRDGQTQYKCAPPLRERENQEQLWHGLIHGTLNFVATDHSPAPPDLKQMETGDFMKAWGGISSLQFALPALWTAAKERGCTLSDMAQWLCTGPADFIEMKQKGRIEAGCDADLIVWDPGETLVLTGEEIQHRHKITPYIGQELAGVVHQTYLSGQLAYDDGDFVKLNGGQILLRSPESGQEENG